jgi:hypothetical protein
LNFAEKINFVTQKSPKAQKGAITDGGRKHGNVSFRGTSGDVTGLSKVNQRFSYFMFCAWQASTTVMVSPSMMYA